MISKKILIVDDDSSIISMLSYAFRNKGYEIINARNGEEAKKLLVEQIPDIIITDALMPKKDGFTFLKELRSIDEYSNIPIIIISGVYKTFSIIQNAINELGASDYFTKPFTLQKLVERVQKLCPIYDYSKKEDKGEADEIIELKNASKYLFSSDVSDNGEFKVIPIYKVIANLFNKKRTGLLTVNDQSVVKKIFIKNGVPIEVSSNIVGEWLGRLLVRENVITSEEYKETLEIMSSSNKKHGEILLENGLITPHELYEYLKLQMTEKIINIFNWKEGVYHFIEDVDFDNISPKKINVCQLILKGIRERVDIDFIIKELNELKKDSVFSIKNKEEIINYFGFSGTEIKLLKLFNGSNRLSNLYESIPDSINDFYILLYTLLLFDSLNLIDETTKRERNIILASKYTTKKDLKLSTKDKAMIEKIRKLYNDLAKLNYYELLDISHEADKNTIKKAYFKLAKEFHPDKFSSDKFEEIRGRANKIFSKIASAYQILSDDDLRDKYDKGAKTEEEEEKVTQANKVLSAELQFQKGTTYLKSKQFDKADEAFQWAIKLNPEEAEYHLYQAISIFENPKRNSPEDKFKVKEILEKVILINANLDQAHYYLAKVYKLEDHVDIAEKHFYRALTINPKNIDAKRELRLIQMRRKKKKGFIKSLFK